LKNLRRGDLFLLTRVDQGDDLEGLRERLRKINPGAKIVETVHHPDCLFELRTGEQRELPLLAGKRVLALSSIGRPESFERTLTSLGALLVEKIRFPDHHWYNEDELREIGAEALRKEAEFIVTTEKDTVRIPRGTALPVEILYLKISLKIVKGEEILEELFENVEDNRQGS
jgi:tetraacyldisaccharide 4'-kinase